FGEFALPFYVRRIFRIWPAALLWLVVPLLAARYFNQSGVFGHLLSDVPASVAAALQIENVYAALCGHSATTPCGQADVYWSLSLEEQFYIFFPLLLYLMRRSFLKRVLLLVTLIQLFLIRPYEGLIWSLRTDAILLGVLMALLQSEGQLQLQIRTTRERAACGVLAIGLLGLIAVISVTPALRFNAGMLALVSAALLLIASADADLILPWRGVRPLLLWVGSRSFAIYLVHNPCFRATREAFARLDLLPSNNEFSWLMLIAALLLIAAVTELTYRAVEMPLRLRGRRLARRWPAAPPVVLQPSLVEGLVTAPRAPL
ncbi:MAG: acyltransferase, partial [Sinobacteraceae bacterium]|nr:acyltransferase [Nevskiaceae bacterium]